MPWKLMQFMSASAEFSYDQHYVYVTLGVISSTKHVIWEYPTNL